MNDIVEKSEDAESAEVPVVKIQTSRFGVIEVPESTIIDFPDGMVGFRDVKRFVIFDCGEDGVLKWLQAVEEPEVAFIICESALLVQDYNVILGEKECQTLKLKDSNDAVICLILVIPEDFQETTANLLGPVIMNAQDRVGMQLVLVNPEYSTKQKVFKQGSKAASEGGANAGS